MNDTFYAPNPWHGKKIVWLGTSVPYGSNTFGGRSYASIAAHALGCTLVPAAVPGQAIHAKRENGALHPLTYGSTALTRAEYAAAGWSIPEAPITPWLPGSENNAEHPGPGYNDYYRTWEHIFPLHPDADLYVFDVAPNNTDFGMDDWNAFDTENWAYRDGSSFADHRTTFLGALLYLMDKMYDAQPQARMALVLGSAFAYEAARSAFDLLQQTWHIPVIDLWGRVNTSPRSLAQLRSKNGTDAHPSDFGHRVLGQMLTQELLRIG